VRNRHTWTVTAINNDGALVVHELGQGRVTLPAGFVARHVELGWAVTGYGTQGVTVDHGICVIEPTTSRAPAYVGMTRGRRTNAAVLADPAGSSDPAETFSCVIQRPANAITALAMRDRLHGYAVVDLDDDAQRMRARLDRLARRPALTKVLSRG
jgi:hypothetical protein